MLPTETNHLSAEETQRKQHLVQLGFLKDPKDESFFDMLKICVYPYFKWNSFTAVVLLLDIFLYILSVSLDTSRTSVLSPSSYALYFLGYISPSDIIQDHQYYRLVSSLFLHAGIFGVSLNTILCQSATCVGGSVVCGGILVCLSQESLIFNQTSKQHFYAFFSSTQDSHLLPLVKSLLLLSVFAVSHTASPLIPLVAHIGGYIMGYVISLALAQQENTQKIQDLNILWLVVSFVLLMIPFPVFVLFKQALE